MHRDRPWLLLTTNEKPTMFPYPSSSENYFTILNDPVRTIDGSLRTTTKTDASSSVPCPATAALEILIGKDACGDKHHQTRQQSFVSSSSGRRSQNDDELISFEDDRSTPNKQSNHDLIDLAAFPLIGWYSDEEDDEPETDHKTTPVVTTTDALSAILNDVQRTEHIEDTQPLLTAGKRCRSDLTMSKRSRLVRSIALNSHLSLLEASFEPLQHEPRTSMLKGSCSATSLSKKFDVEKWLEAVDHHDNHDDDYDDDYASPIKMRKTMHRQQQETTNLQETMHSLAALVTT